MTWHERLEAAKTEIARRKVIASAATPGPWHRTTDPLGHHIENGDGRGRIVFSSADRAGGCDVEHRDHTYIAANDPAHVLQTLEIHRLILALVDPWLVTRLDRPSPMTQLVRAVLDLYAPVTETSAVTSG